MATKALLPSTRPDECPALSPPARQRPNGLRLVRRQSSAEAELGRLAAELHDRLAQSLWGLDAELAAIGDLALADPEAAHRRLAEAREIVSGTYREVRLIIGALRADPPVELDLERAIHASLVAFTRQCGVIAEIDPTSTIVSLPKCVELQLLAILEGALANVRRHASASRVTVSFRRAGAGWELSIQDDGCGFQSDLWAEDGQHFGLKIIRERAATFGGTVRLQSAPGQGTTVIVWLPDQDQSSVRGPGRPDSAGGRTPPGTGSPDR
jgi:two-component system nitrate/nitrite sensor histidine kinase NarX